MLTLPRPIAFQWDSGNKNKNFAKHKTANEECEQAFFDRSKKIYPDAGHSQSEPRYWLIGKTKRGRVLFISFTIRHNQIRVISARDINRKEIKYYN